MKVRKSVYDILAFLFAPQLSTIYWFFLLYIQASHANLLYLAIAVVFASLIQIVSLLAYAKIAGVGLYVMNKERRLPLFLVSILSYTIGFIVLIIVSAPFIFKALMLAYIINTVIAALITRYLTKISIHVWGISGPSVAILYAYGYPAFIAMLLLAILVGYSRIKIKAHTPKQVAYALACSILITIAVIYGIGSSVI